jgi:glycosyltransferase involved in cell wall biosynthesis
MANTPSLLDCEKAIGVQPNSAQSDLLIVETHPIQYHIPVYRHLAQKLGISVSVVFGSDFSIAGYHDREFGSNVAWDTDLVSGYRPIFLSRSREGGARNDSEVTTRGLDAVLSQVQPRAILCVGYSPRFHLDAFRCARRTRRPILFRGETTDHAVRRGPVKSYVRNLILRGLYNHCPALLYVGKRSKEHFLRLGVEQDRLFFSPYCVDVSTFQAGERARKELRGPARTGLGLQEDDFVIAFSGKLSSRKGPDQLVNAVRQLPRDVRDRCVILFIGDGQLKESTQKLSSLRPSVRTRYVGFQPQGNLSRFYHAADLLALPSIHSETWGLVVNEALHHGLPAIVSNAVGCAPDLIDPGKTGETFSTGCVPEITSALLRCIRLVGIERVRSQCRAKVDNYSVAKAAEGIAAAYSVLDNRANR